MRRSGRHLLRIARIGPHEQHPRMTQPHTGDAYRHRGTVDQDELVGPVESVGLGEREAQGHLGRGGRRLRGPPILGIAARKADKVRPGYRQIFDDKIYAWYT